METLKKSRNHYALLGRLWVAVNTVRPQNGFTRSLLASAGWVSQPDYAHAWGKL